MKNLLIREAVLDDLEQLLVYEQALIVAERPFDPTIRKPPVTYYDLQELIVSKEAKVVLAEIDGRIVSTGYGVAKRGRHYLDHEWYAYLGFMYTEPQYRGMGINGKIIAELYEWARSKGLYEVRLTVYEDNLPAIKAYEKVGFKKHIVEMRLRLNDHES